MAESIRDPDLSEAQAARILGISDRTLRRYRRAGQVAHMALPSGRVRYSLADLISFREGCRSPAKV
ncbi:helix-turn-helix domain-containing protein [Novosphingobium sp. Fuku2-ISO-50]|uniref:helix-turn-helix domain-containing protein n=1 Tax=Novosphingobium sp. Fuku2-ISO-50 TaxID=1739114 RepID=UPI00076C5365|nr:helix-turn-helix domain-containing protein [Novosphingobium sp. Fuku2-ISO-50]KUR74799.1 hypothetical protein AQZ50_17265 [Novosphingobium sp. Fuku2-ISO-50]MDR3388796.1 helix-turn-helix domain-containing protein [Rudaea sp.]